MLSFRPKGQHSRIFVAWLDRMRILMIFDWIVIFAKQMSPLRVESHKQTCWHARYSRRSFFLHFWSKVPNRYRFLVKKGKSFSLRILTTVNFRNFGLWETWNKKRSEIGIYVSQGFRISKDSHPHRRSHPGLSKDLPLPPSPFIRAPPTTSSSPAPSPSQNFEMRWVCVILGV